MFNQTCGALSHLGILVSFLLRTLEVPLIGNDSKVSTHFFDFRRGLDRLVCLDVKVGLLRAGRHPDVLCHHKIFLAFDTVLELSLAFILVTIVLILVVFVDAVLCSRLDFVLEKLEAATIEEVVDLSHFSELVELDFYLLKQ